MARLTAKARRALPDSAFAGPGRTYPVEDKGHAQAALGRLHNAPKSEQAHIHARAEKKLAGKCSGGAMAKGGKVKSAAGKAKVAKVMHEWGQGNLHSGSKQGPEVKNQKQAVAIALSEARKEPMKKAAGGHVKCSTPFPW